MMGVKSMKSKRNSSGQAMVETALMLSFVLILMLGIVEVGFLLWAGVQVTNSAREGARAGTLWDNSSPYPSCVEAVSRAVGGTAWSQPTGELPPSWAVTVTVSDNCATNNLTTGDQLSVTVTHDFALPLVTNFPIISDIIGPTFTFTRTVHMRVQ